MGTAGDWMSVVFWGMFWAAGMMLWEARRRNAENIKPVLSLPEVLGVIFAGLGVGLGTTFHWRVFHWPLILFMAACFAGLTVFGRIAKRRLVSDPENN
jgi:hypothetical protein